MATKEKFSISRADLERLKRESEQRRAHEPFAESATYDAQSGALTVALRGGSTVRTQARALRGLGSASDEQLTNVRIHDGRALFWADVDVQHLLIAFLGEALGIPTLHAATRRAGNARTAAKSAAARENGKLGGRPRKKEPAT